MINAKEDVAKTIIKTSNTAALKDSQPLIEKVDELVDPPMRNTRHRDETSANLLAPRPPHDAIAIVGAGCRLPGANTLEELWTVVSQGQSRLESLRPERCNPKQTYRAVQDPAWIAQREFYGNFLDDVAGFDHAFFGISPREAIHMDPQQRLLLETAFEAMDSSGYLHGHRRERGDPVGCFIGASYTEYLENTSTYTPSAFTATSTIRAFLSGKISYHFGWTGPSEVIDTACSASLVAVHRACRAIQAGECSMALAGGVNIITGVNNYFDLAKAGFLSPTGQCKPFDDSADGYCRADGVCLVVLKPLRQAIEDRDKIMGVIPAVATNQGGVNAPGITVPDGSCQKALYRTLLDRSGLKSDDVSYIEAHGTGTRVGDPIEMASIRDVFGGPQRNDPLYIGSLKSNIGHSETAAGAAGLLKVLSMLQHGGVPPLRGFKRLNRNIPPLESDKIIIPTEQIPWTAQGRRVACVSSYGASGSNSALLCAEWRGADHDILPSISKLSKPKSPYPIILSAATPESLQRQVKDLVQHLSKPMMELDFSDVAYTLSQRRKHHRFRWSVLAENVSDLIKQLRGLGSEHITTCPKTPRKVILAFSGQSGTKIGLDPSILSDNPRLAHHIESCNRVLLDLGCPDIMTALHQTEPISDPTVLQCGLVAVQYSCARCWIEGGLEVTGIVGHSLGELAALAVSGVLSLEDMLRVVYMRAELIKTKFGNEKGAMLAIHAKLETVKAMIEAAKERSPKDDQVEIACYNSTTSHVVVGSTESIQMALTVLKEEAQYHGIRSHRVDVTHGFHSRLVEPLLQGLSEVEKSIEFREPAIRIETSTRLPNTFGRQQNVEYLTSHARQPVYFVDAVRRLEAELGPCIWLEAGVGTPVIPMVRRAVADPATHTFQSVTSPELAAADLWREGVAATCWSFLTPAESDLHHVWLPPYSFDRPAKHWLEHVDRAVEERNAAVLGGLANGSPTNPESSHEPPRLVTYKGGGSGSDPHMFHLNTNTQRFARIVQGHSVRGKPLCPASVYMEAAVMALDLLGPPVRGKGITFRNTVFSRPLGYDPNQAVQLRLDPARDTGMPGNRHFVVQSSARCTHSEGDVEIANKALADCHLDKRLLEEKIAKLRNNKGTETFKKTTAYHLFSRVVEYADLMRGIINITLGPTEAVARIQVAPTVFPASESTVMGFYDAITIDTFIQVLGLLVNHSSESEPQGTTDDINVASSVSNMELKPVDFGLPQIWTVYATYSVLDGKTTSGDVYVLSEKGDVVFTATDIRMGLDSLASIELADEMEAKLGLKMEIEDLGSETVQSLLDSISVSNSGTSSTFQSGYNTSLTTPSPGSDAGELAELAMDSMGHTKTPGDMGRTTSTWVRPKESLDSRYNIEHHVYKEVDGLEILADVYVPSNTTPNPMCVALMIHGGGHLTLSRRAVRPRQTKFLLANGILPVSLDYRLCPQVNVLDGAMADVRDACVWAHEELPQLMRSRGITVDTSRYVVIGWSTGGTLAMTTAWTMQQAGLCGPTAILAFYCPVEYDPKEPLNMGQDHGHRTMSLSEIRRRLSTKPTTQHIVSNETDTTKLGWVKPGDPRSELVLALIKEDRGMSLLFNDAPLGRGDVSHSGSNNDSSNDELPYPDAERAAAFSPLVHLRRGDYRTPTYLVFGDCDEIAPFDKAVEFAHVMEQQGVRGGLLSVQGAKHIFDLDLAPGSEGWKPYIEPGYEFLFSELADAGGEDQ
ncbi:polyketide synthase [Apiospora arundinis]|uniref:Polyketide synthase n=1 Tax=Apiospora arundinis TaxID=335852 RepID=A0ABR2IAD0_9PEZI